MSGAIAGSYERRQLSAKAMKAFSVEVEGPLFHLHTEKEEVDLKNAGRQQFRLLGPGLARGERHKDQVEESAVVWERNIAACIGINSFRRRIPSFC